MSTGRTGRIPSLLSIPISDRRTAANHCEGGSSSSPAIDPALATQRFRRPGGTALPPNDEVIADGQVSPTGGWRAHRTTPAVSSREDA